MATQEVVSMSDSLVDVIERLFREFEGRCSLTEIVAVVQECRTQLCCSPPSALPELVDRLARQRLRSLSDVANRGRNLASTTG
jgi:hypothetical protein